MPKWLTLRRLTFRCGPKKSKMDKITLLEPRPNFSPLHGHTRPALGRKIQQETSVTEPGCTISVGPGAQECQVSQVTIVTVYVLLGPS